MSATYPAFGQLIGSAMELIDNTVLDAAINGRTYGRTYTDGPKVRFAIAHVLTLADRNTLIAFHNTQRKIAFDFVWDRDGQTYAGCLFEAAPKIEATDTPGIFAAEVMLRQA